MDILRRLRDDQGETLVEVLMAVIILGIAAAAILAGLQLSIAASDINRKQATGGAYVRSYAEAIEKYVATTGNYVKCAAADTYTPAVVGFTVPANYSAQQSAAVPLAGDGSAPVGSCPTIDAGVQRVNLTMASSDGRAPENLTIILRRACDPSAPCSD